MFNKHQTEFETLDSKIAKGVMKIISAQVKRKISFSEETFKKTKTARARCKIKPKMRVDVIALSAKFGDLITADHIILNVENESMCGRKML